MSDTQSSLGGLRDALVGAQQAARQSQVLTAAQTQAQGDGLPKVDAQGRAYLVQDVTYYSKSALFDAFKSWRDGGPARFSSTPRRC